MFTKKGSKEETLSSWVMGSAGSNVLDLDPYWRLKIGIPWLLLHQFLPTVYNSGLLLGATPQQECKTRRIENRPNAGIERHGARFVIFTRGKLKSCFFRTPISVGKVLASFRSRYRESDIVRVRVWKDDSDDTHPPRYGLVLERLLLQ